jgi:hypothetical protein
MNDELSVKNAFPPDTQRYYGAEKTYSSCDHLFARGANGGRFLSRPISGSVYKYVCKRATSSSVNYFQLKAYDFLWKQCPAVDANVVNQVITEGAG